MQTNVLAVSNITPGTVLPSPCARHSKSSNVFDICFFLFRQKGGSNSGVSMRMIIKDTHTYTHTHKKTQSPLCCSIAKARNVEQALDTQHTNHPTADCYSLLPSLLSLLAVLTAEENTQWQSQQLNSRSRLCGGT